jgi:8-amino-3,8-dideoxy-alpha-D-manno-octulosonate transaminase
MSIYREEQNTKRTQVSRRDFLGTGMTAASLAALGLTTQGKKAVAGQSPADDKPIDPGYFASQYYGSEEEEALHDVLESGCSFRFFGPGDPQKVKHFEEQYAKYMGVTYALGVTSGTAALDCAVTALDIGPGDEVILPAYTWWSDYTCVLMAGALPVFADIDRSLCLDPEDFARKITPRTKAVIPVHLLGGPCDMDPIMETARQKGIAVLEDAAQCVGGTYNGKRLGTIGNVGIYSFQLCKMISSGEGGALVTNDPVIYERAARFEHMGLLDSLFVDRLGKSRVDFFPGENFRMSEFTGAVMDAQLPKLDTMLTNLRRVAAAVHDGIKDLPGIQLRKQPDPKGDIGYGIYFELENKQARDRCIDELRKRKIPAGTLTGSVLLPIHPGVMNKQTPHRNWPSFSSPEGQAIKYGPECCRQTLGIFDRFVLVRMGPKYTNRMVERIVAAIREVYPTVT